MPVKEQPLDIRHLLDLECELEALRRSNGIPAATPLWVKIVDRIVSIIPEPKRVDRKRYLKLALCCGWFCGAHRYYAGHKVQALCYLLLCWTGIPFAMTIVDILQVLLKTMPDENGQIEL